MLSDEVIDKVVERLVNRIEQGNTYILEQIGKSIKKIGTLTPSKAQELVQIMRYGGDYDKIVKKLAEITKLNVKDIYKIFAEVAKENYLFAKQFYKYRNKKYIPWDENIELQNQVRAIAKITADKYINLSNTLAFATHSKSGKVIYNSLATTYQNALDTAIINAGQGKETFDSAMRRVIRDLVESGIRTVAYESGKSMRLESAVRLAMQGGLRDMNNQLQLQFGESFDADGVEISVHENPAPDHQYVQGKQFSTSKYDEDGNEIFRGEFEKFQSDETAISYDGEVFEPEYEGHDRRSIGQYNCYHYIFRIVLGVNKPLHTNEELQAIIDRNNKGFDFDGKHYTMYEGQQLQRKIETEIRKAKDLQITARATDDDILTNKAQSKINALTKKYNELNNASGLKSQIQRASVSGYHKIKVQEPKDIVKINPENLQLKVEYAKERIKRLEEDIRVDDLFLKNRGIDENSNNAVASLNRLNKKELAKRKEELAKYEGLQLSGKFELNTPQDCRELLDYANITLTDNATNEVDFKILKENTKKLYEMVNEYPELRKRIYSSGLTVDINKLAPNELAKSSNYVITLNNKYYKNYKKLEDTMYFTTGTNWHCKTTKENLINENIVHEFGHVLSYRMRDIEYEKTGIYNLEYGWDKYIYDDFMKYASKKLNINEQKMLDTYVSDYGKSDPAEAFAEIYASSRVGVNNKLGNVLNKYLEERLK